MAYLASHKYITEQITDLRALPPYWIGKLGLVRLLQLSELEIQLEGMFQFKIMTGNTPLAPQVAAWIVEEE